MATNKPNLGNVPRELDPELTRFLELIKERLEIGEGTRFKQNKLDQWATLEDLEGMREVIIVDDKGDRLNIGANGAADVNLSDQTTPVLIVPFNKVNNTTTLSVDSTKDTRTITVTSTTGFVDGAFVAVTSVNDNRYYTGYQVGAVAGSVVTLDTPLDFDYTAANSQVTNGVTDMNVDGSVTTEIFSLRAADPGIPVTIDVTRILFHCLTASGVDLALFGDLPALTNGLVLRRVDGTYNNIFNAKTNGDLAGLMYDWEGFVATNPVQGVDGFTGRLTFAGSSKIGVAVRIGTGEDLQMLIQDDLTGLDHFEVIIEGHVVEGN